jgi:hypothetical protein
VIRRGSVLGKTDVEDTEFIEMLDALEYPQVDTGDKRVLIGFESWQ